jgi:hypothetical protein
MPQWTRAYPANVTVVEQGAWTVGGCAYLVLGLISGWIVYAIVVSVLWQAIIWRRYVLGIYVGPDGIQVRRLLRAFVIPWTDVFQVHTQQVGPWGLTELRLTDGRTGADVRTGVYRRQWVRRRRLVELDPRIFDALVKGLTAEADRRRVAT